MYEIFRHFALIEKRINLPKIRVIKLFISRKILPKMQLLSGHKSLVLFPFFWILLNGQIHRFFCQMLVESFEV